MTQGQIFCVLTVTIAILGCATADDIRNNQPDEIVAFNYGWNEAALCSARQIDNIYSSANLRHILWSNMRKSV
jgi:hypothetical protein